MCEKFWTLSNAILICGRCTSLPFNNSAPAGHLEARPRRAENDSQARNPHETKSHERTEFLVTRNQGKHPDRGCAKASHDDRISGRGELDRASPKKMYEKFWTLSLSEEFRPLLQNSSKSCPAKYFPSKFLTAQRALCPTRAYTC